MSSCFQDLVLADEARSEDGDIAMAVLRPVVAVSIAIQMSCADSQSGLATLLSRLLTRPPVPRAPIAVAMDVRLVDPWHAALAADDEAAKSITRLRDSGRIELKRLSTDDPITFGLDDCAVFEDGDGCAVALEVTRGGRSVELYRSWDATAPRVQRRRERIADALAGRLRGFHTTDADDVLRALKRESTGGAGSLRGPGRSVLVPPAGFALRPYQEQAVEHWLSNDGRGVLAMATGSGKTLVAVTAVSRLIESTGGRPTIVVTTPFIHLVDQWASVFEQWGIAPIRCYESSDVWEAAATQRLDMAAVHAEPLVLVATTQTAASDRFSRLLRRALRTDGVLIADEVHHLGTSGSEPILDARYRWRMGLSATPERHGDDAGTDRILDFFGGVVVEFGIADGIHAGYLCPYHYQPVLVDFTSDELDRYRAILARLELAARNGGAGGSSFLELLQARQDSLDGALGKIDALRKQTSETRLDRAIVYCASRTQMGAAAQVLRDTGQMPRPFTAEESRAARTELIADFTAGRVPAITAIRALDEGVDIPSIRQAHLLASAGNPTQFIQRRGRILRTAPGKQQALLVDYVTVPQGNGLQEARLVRQEMRRALEFGSTSLDPRGVVSALMPIIERFGCQDLLEENAWG